MKSIVNEIETNFASLAPFKFAINYAELDANSPENIHHSHFHEGCEIYINLSGDVSFMVEDHLYTVNNGDIIITRPFEYHNCIYNKNELHRQFCIIFESDGNEHILDMFFKRDKGEGNLITISNDNAEELTDCCNLFLTKELSHTEKYSLFFRIITLLGTGVTNNSPNTMPESVRLAIDYIIHNLTEQITVEKLAAVAHVSVNTLERHFKEASGISPSNYLKSKRLANAARLLRKGASVTAACFDSGFVNCSHFIVQFKNRFGVTPYKYRAQN